MSCPRSQGSSVSPALSLPHLRAVLCSQVAGQLAQLCGVLVQAGGAVPGMRGGQQRLHQAPLRRLQLGCKWSAVLGKQEAVGEAANLAGRGAWQGSRQPGWHAMLPAPRLQCPAAAQASVGRAALRMTKIREMSGRARPDQQAAHQDDMPWVPSAHEGYIGGGGAVAEENALRKGRVQGLAMFKQGPPAAMQRQPQRQAAAYLAVDSAHSMYSSAI